MVFSLFRKTVRADETSAADGAKSTKKSGGVQRASGRRAAQEAARMTAEKIDRIESEMIADVDDRARAAGMDNATGAARSDGAAKAEPLVISPPHENDDEVKLALAKLRKKARKAKQQGKRKPSAEELLAELTLREATRTNTVAEVLAEDQQTLMGADNPDTDPGLEFEVSAPISSADTANEDTGLIGEPGAQSAQDTEDDLAIDVIDGALPDEVEEAAILFSNGQFDAAGAVLRDTLEQNAHPNFRAMNWFMLFDLYRAAGDRDSFEQLAVDYANEVEKSPPAWNDELLESPEPEGPKPGASPSEVQFLGEISEDATKVVDQLIRAARHKRDCSVDFSSTSAVSITGAQEITRLFEAFEQSGHPIAVIGLPNLETMVRGLLEPEEGSADESFWKLAMQLLRVKDAQTEFDDLSIEYCVAYEISPPPWVPYEGEVLLSDASGPGATIADQAPDADPAAPGIDSGYVTFQGDLCGKIDNERAAIKHLAANGNQVRIDCRRLRRMDFMAAGELLNEQLALQSKNCTLHFDEPNYLVYALMHVMGMQETARITRRRV